jgi:hypothetical protein
MDLNFPLKFPENNKGYPAEIHFQVIAESPGPKLANDQPGQTIQAPPTNKCILYMPQGIMIADGVTYGNTDLGAIGAVVESALGGSGSGGKAPTKQFIDNLMQSANKSSAKLFGLNVANQFGSGVGGAVKSATGIALNPNTRTLFENVNMRSFQFQFKLIPESAKESRSIKQIVHYFRSELYPEELPGPEGLSLGYKFPNKFQIDTYYDTKAATTQFLPCYLHKVNAVYNASSMGFHKDGEWTEVDLTLEFMEERTLTRDDVDRGGF